MDFMRDEFPMREFFDERADELLDGEFVMFVGVGEVDGAVFESAELFEKDA